MTIKTIAFYKKIQDNEKSKKLRSRLDLKNFSYEKCLNLLIKTFKKYNADHEFIISSDMHTNLDNLDTPVFRNNLDNLYIMEAITCANTNYIKKNYGKMMFIGADHLINQSIDPMFDEDFDLAFWSIGEDYDHSHKMNISMAMFLVNKTKNNGAKINDFFEQREEICCNLSIKEKKWFADQKSISLLLQKEEIISNIYINKTNSVFEFNGLKIKIFKYGKDFISPVTEDGKINFVESPVLVDFIGSKSKEFLDDVYYQLTGR